MKIILEMIGGFMVGFSFGQDIRSIAMGLAGLFILMVAKREGWTYERT